MRPYILIPYYSASGSVEKMALYIAKGVEQAGLEARVRRIEPIGKGDALGPLYVAKEDIANCAGMILGSPTRFGQVAAAVRLFWDKTGDIWHSGEMIGKPGAVFTSSASMHGGQESTLLGMMMPMIHHGMLIVGIPYSEKAIHDTTKGGGPYGASTVTGDQYGHEMDGHERDVCIALGRRLANIAKKLQ
nr:NAD(P)H:quinone oxidoreductase [Candidatus Synchoanobacter obligatus]